MHAAGDAAVPASRKRRRGRARRPRDAETPGEPPERGRLLGQRVGLELVQDLEPVLDRAQVDERVAEEAPERRREIAALGQPEDGAQAVALAEPRVVTGVQELERLDEELDLADAADAELDVAALAALGAQRPVDGAFIPRISPTMAGSRPGRKTKGRTRSKKRAATPASPAAEARLDERLALPQLRPLGDVGAVALEREDDAAHPSLGAEPEVHAKGVALVGDGLERVHDGPRRLGEEVAVGDAPLEPPVVSPSSP